MSPSLSLFLADWLEWATTGAPDGSPKDGFSRYYGLCHHAWKRSVLLGEELELLLDEEFGERSGFPFEGKIDYFMECDLGRAHLNPSRLAWVRKKLLEEL